MRARATTPDPPLRRALERWLALERRAHEAGAEAAEQALQALFDRLPLLSPSPGFADRVVSALHPTGAGRLFQHWGVRAAVALCLVQTGLLLGAVVATAAALGRFLDLPDLVVAATRAGVFLLELAAGAVALLGLLFDLAGAATAAASSPAGLLLASLCAALLASALYPLIRSVEEQRNVDHV